MTKSWISRRMTAPAGVPGGAVEQLGEDHGGEAERVSEPASSKRSLTEAGRLLQDVAADVGVEHVVHQKSFAVLGRAGPCALDKEVVGHL